MKLETRSLITLVANALNEQIHFFAAVALGQRHGGDVNLIEAGSLTAMVTLEMDVVVVMMARYASLPT